MLAPLPAVLVVGVRGLVFGREGGVAGAGNQRAEGHALVVLEGEVLQAEELKGAAEAVVGLVGAVGPQVAVVVEQEAEALEDEVLAVDGLALEAVVDVAEAEG